MLKSARVLGSAVAVGAVLLLSACGQQSSSPPSPNVISPGEIGQQPIVADDSPGTDSESTSTSDSAPAAPKATTRTAPPKTTVQQQPPSAGEFFAASYVGASDRVLVQRPSEFIPPSVTGEYAAETKLMNLKWESWDKNGGTASGDAYITGGGGPPETVHGVQLILDNPQMHNGKMQYTHYLISYPNYGPDEGRLNTL